MEESNNLAHLHHTIDELKSRVAFLEKELSAKQNGEVKRCKKNSEHASGQGSPLWKNETHYRILFESALNPIMIVNQEGRYIDANDAALRFLETDRDTLLTNTVWDYSPKELVDKQKAEHSPFLGPRTIETAYQVKDKQKTLLLNVVPIQNDEEILLFGIGQEITEKKRKESVMTARLRLLHAAQSQSLEEFLRATLDECETLTESKIGFYHFLENDQKTISLQVWSTDTINTCKAEGAGRHYPVEEAGVWVDCIREHGPVVHNLYAALPYRKGMPPGHVEVVRELVVPVVRGEKIVAILGVGNKPTDYSESDMDAVTSLADLAWDIAERKRIEKELDKSQLLYRHVAETAKEIILVHSFDGRIVYINRAGLEFIECHNDDLIGKNIIEMIPAEHMAAVQEHQKRRLQGEHGKHFYEIELLKPNGKKIPVEVSSVIIEGNEGEKQVLIVARDISERKKAEESLRQSEQNYREIFNATTEGIFVHDAVTGQLLDVNDAAIRIFGCKTKEEVLASNNQDFALNKPPFSKEDALNRIHMADKQGPHIFEWLAPRANGDMFWTEISLHSTRIDNQKRVLAVVRDITERKRGEAERELLTTAIEQAAETILITDPSATIQYANPAFERTTGYNRKEIIGQNPRILKSGKQDKAFYAAMWRTLRRGKTWEGRFINKRKDGTLYTEEATISPVYNASGAVVNYVAVKRDITYELEIEQQLLHAQKMESVGRLAGGVAHDFNNLLTAIINYTEMVRRRLPSDHPVHNWLNEVSTASERSANITRQLLAFARKQSVSPEILDLNEVVSSMLKLLHRLIGEDIELVFVPGQTLWAIKIDPTQIDQILANLCVNARDAILNTGKITIETRNTTISETHSNSHAGIVPGEYAVLSVSDNGCGMEKEVMNQIFEPFFTTKELGKGTGLGLATVYGIVKQNNGYILVDSEPDKGTTFEIYLPRFAGGIQETGSRTVAEVSKARGETVLLVEDEESLRTTCNLLLNMLGYKVLEAPSPEAAIAIALQHPGTIDLLLTDVIMPGMNGKELSEQLCHTRPEIKVLFMSGYTADIIDRHGVLEQGINFLEKPFSLTDFASKLRQVLDSRTNTDESD